MSTARQDLAHTTLQLLFIGALIAGTFRVLRPFLLAFIWATTIVVATWPLMVRAQGWLGGRRGLAVAVMTGGLLLLLVGPLSIATMADQGNCGCWFGSVRRARVRPRGTAIKLKSRTS